MGSGTNGSSCRSTQRVRAGRAVDLGLYGAELVDADLRRDMADQVGGGSQSVAIAHRERALTVPHSFQQVVAREGAGRAQHIGTHDDAGRFRGPP